MECLLPYSNSQPMHGRNFLVLKVNGEKNAGFDSAAQVAPTNVACHFNKWGLVPATNQKTSLTRLTMNRSCAMLNNPLGGFCCQVCSPQSQKALTESPMSYCRQHQKSIEIFEQVLMGLAEIVSVKSWEP